MLGRLVRFALSRALCALSLALVAGGASALDEAKGKPPPANEKSAEAAVARFCANVGPSVAEARIAWQSKRLSELDAEVKQRVADLEKAEAAAKEWVGKRETMMKSANEDIVAIYGKMDAEAAAKQIGAMEDAVAVAILAKLKPAAASSILGEMNAERAAKLASLLAGAAIEGQES